MDLNTQQLIQWTQKLSLNIHDPSLLLALEHFINDSQITGQQFDMILDQNLLPRLLAESSAMSPSTANLIRKLWHVDFFPSVQYSDRCVHRHHRPEVPSLSLEEVADLVERIVEVATPYPNVPALHAEVKRRHTDVL